MTVVRDLDREHKRARTFKQAAKLRDKLEPELALNDQLDPAWENHAGQVLGDLYEKHPGLRTHPPDLGSPSLSHRARAHLHTGGRTRIASHPAVKAARQRGDARLTQTARRTRSTAGRALDLTGLPGAGESTTRFALKLIGWAMGLSLLYLLLTNALTALPGKAAVEIGSGGITNTLRALVSPTADPLSPNTRPAAQPTAHALGAAAPLGQTGTIAGAVRGAQQITNRAAKQVKPKPTGAHR